MLCLLFQELREHRLNRLRFQPLAAQALYIADTGAGDPYRIRIGTFGFWVKPNRRNGAAQAVLTKRSSAALGYYIGINGDNVVRAHFFD